MESEQKDFINKYDGVRKHKMHRGKKIDRDWMEKLFDTVYVVVGALPLRNFRLIKKKLHCTRDFDLIPEKEIKFIKDRREDPKMHKTSLREA